MQHLSDNKNPFILLLCGLTRAAPVQNPPQSGQFAGALGCSWLTSLKNKTNIVFLLLCEITLNELKAR